jgi:hypothetical protein
MPIAVKLKTVSNTIILCNVLMKTKKNDYVGLVFAGKFQ